MTIVRRPTKARVGISSRLEFPYARTAEHREAGTWHAEVPMAVEDLLAETEGQPLEGQDASKNAAG